MARLLLSMTLFLVVAAAALSLQSCKSPTTEPVQRAPATDLVVLPDGATMIAKPGSLEREIAEWVAEGRGAEARFHIATEAFEGRHHTFAARPRPNGEDCRYPQSRARHAPHFQNRWRGSERTARQCPRPLPRAARNCEEPPQDHARGRASRRYERLRIRYPAFGASRNRNRLKRAPISSARQARSPARSGKLIMARVPAPVAGTAP